VSVEAALGDWCRHSAALSVLRRSPRPGRKNPWKARFPTRPWHTAEVGPVHRGRGGIGCAPGAVRSATRRPTPPLGALLHATAPEWSAADDGAQVASALEIDSGHAVMASGGLDKRSRNRPVPDFIAEGGAGRISYYVGETGRGPRLGPNYGRQISPSVGANYRPTGSSAARRFIPALMSGRGLRRSAHF